jgi:hypothetical protein
MARYLVIIGIIIFLIVAGGTIAAQHTGTTPPDVGIQGPYDPPVVELSAEEAVTWTEEVRAAGYNVDVTVQAHAWQRHNEEATAAIRCLTNNGTSYVLSEKNSRNLHLICVDPSTGDTYVAVIERIQKYADTLKNATSRLITAFKSHVPAAQYIEWETAHKAISVRLMFKAGELFFTGG